LPHLLLSEEQKIVMWWRSVGSIFAVIIKEKLTSTPVLVILNSDSDFELYITQEGCARLVLMVRSGMR